METKFVMDTLEDVTNCKLESHLLIDFLKNVCSEDPGSNDDHLLHWPMYKEFEPLMTNITVVHCKGCWIPKVCSKSELSKQKPWKKFIPHYTTSPPDFVIREERNSQDFQPVNFDELVSTSFWISLYEYIGHKVLTFIFERCLLVFIIEEELYLLIASKESTLNKSIELAYQSKDFRNKPKPRISTFRPTNNTGESSAIANVVPKQAISESCSLKRKHDEISTSVDMNVIEQDQIEGCAERKRFCHAKQNNPESLKSIEHNESEMPHSGTQSYGNAFNSAFEDHIIRWITPKDDVLKRIILDREALKETLNITSTSKNSSKSEKNQDTKEHSYVAITQDNYFTQNSTPLNWIGKKTVTTKFSKLSALPKQFSGLKISNILISEAKYVTISGYILSEAQARHYNIRIHPRKRQRKTKNAEGTKPKTVRDAETATITEKAHNVEKLKCSVESFKPYHPLPTYSILYNASSWTRPSEKHFTKKIISLSKEDGAKLLVNEMLDSVVSSKKSPNVKNLVNRDLLVDLENIAISMVSFHKKVKDSHKLVKTCLTYWMNNAQKKKSEKEYRRIKRINSAREKTLRKMSILRSGKKDQNVPNCEGKCVGSGEIERSSTLNQNGASLLNNSTSSLTSNSNIPYNLRHLSQFFPSQSTDKSYRSNSKILTQKSFKDADDVRKLARYNNVKQTVPHSCILSTLRQVMHLSNANSLLGSRRNIKKFFSFVKKSIMLGGLQSSFQLVQLMSELNPQDCSWLQNIEDTNNVAYIFSSVVQWLYSNYILILLRTSFYATETSSGRNKIEFYLKEHWKSLSEKLKNGYIQNKIFKVHPEKHKSFANTKLRLLPKQHNKIRPLVCITNETRYSRMVNNDECRVLLNYMISKVSPASLIGVDCVRNRWSDFIRSQRKDKLPFFYVRADIKDAFPSVKLKLLKEIMRNIAKESGKLIRHQFRTLTIGSKSTQLNAASSLVSENNRHNWHASICSRPCIVQHMTNMGEMDPSLVLRHITGSLNRSIVRMGKRNYEFEYGLPQGWIFSQQLCNIYYGHMEKTHLANFLNDPSELFLRSVDDYFYVSTNPLRVSKFCDKIYKGNSEYNCTMQPDKFSTNVYVTSNRNVFENNRFCDWIHFCGWKFCLATGHSARDLSSYAVQDICYTLSFRLTERNNMETFLINRMGYIRPLRLSSLLLDPSINCKRQIIANIYDAAVMSAFRFYAICRVIYSNSNTFSDSKQVEIFLKAVNRNVNAIARYVRRAHDFLDSKGTSYPCTEEMKSCIKISPTVRKVLNKKSVKAKSDWHDKVMESTSNQQNLLSDSEVKFLVYHAFIVKLTIHAQVFAKGLLPKLKNARLFQRKKITQMQYKYLLETVGFNLPKCFAAMKK